MGSLLGAEALGAEAIVMGRVLQMNSIQTIHKKQRSQAYHQVMKNARYGMRA
jgi:hypothetical protein